MADFEHDDFEYEDFEGYKSPDAYEAIGRIAYVITGNTVRFTEEAAKISQFRAVTDFDRLQFVTAIAIAGFGLSHAQEMLSKLDLDQDRDNDDVRYAVESAIVKHSLQVDILHSMLLLTEIPEDDVTGPRNITLNDIRSSLDS